MNEKRTSVFSNGLIWFGAGVSLAEILTGTYFAPLGFGKAMAAILLGHLLGGLMMFAAGMIGAKERKSAMETVKMSFGEKGGIFFSFLNVLQLVGWTAIMIYDGALAADGVLHTGSWVWCLVIGALIEAEDKYTFRQSTQISMQTGLIGHLRADMDTDGNGFFSSWFDFREELKTDEFKAEFDEVQDGVSMRGNL